MNGASFLSFLASRQIIVQTSSTSPIVGQRKVVASSQESPLMKERLTAHIRSLIASGSEAVALQYLKKSFPTQRLFLSDDPLGEESIHSPLKGIVHKFSNRLLWKVTYRCAAHCQFCTRSRQIGTASGDLSHQDIEQGLAYLREHREINDVILSGGDPLYAPDQTLQILIGLTTIPHIKIYRIGTRLPVQSPRTLEALPLKTLLREVTKIARLKSFIFQLHFEHPDELNKAVHRAISTLKRTRAILVSQTVFLKRINDSVDVLTNLFMTLYQAGVLPYYIYRCDAVNGLEQFVCSINKEREIMTELRRRLSGLATPTHVVDVPGRGKIPVPLEFWSNVDLSQCVDFDGQPISILTTSE